MPPEVKRDAKSSSDDMPISKWQKASVDITNLKFKLGKILDDFSQEEKESTKYEQLMETVNVLFEHVLGPHHDKLEEKIRQEILKELEEEQGKEKAQNGIFSYKTLVIAVSTAVLYKILENLIYLLLTL